MEITKGHGTRQPLSFIPSRHSNLNRHKRQLRHLPSYLGHKNQRSHIGDYTEPHRFTSAVPIRG
jgi:hypothetical protein